MSAVDLYTPHTDPSMSSIAARFTRWTNMYYTSFILDVQYLVINSFGEILFLASFSAFDHQDVISLTCLASDVC